jgi:hypothetical protein
MSVREELVECPGLEQHTGGNRGIEDIKDSCSPDWSSRARSATSRSRRFHRLWRTPRRARACQPDEPKVVSDACEVVKTGQLVKLRVLEVDLARKRISLTMKLDAPAVFKGAERADNGFDRRGSKTRFDRPVAAVHALARRRCVACCMGGFVCRSASRAAVRCLHLDQLQHAT